MVKIQQKNIFLSSACTNPKDYSSINEGTRFFHLLGTIDSCTNVEDCVNLIAEASSLNEIQKKAIQMKNAVLFDWSEDTQIEEASQNKQSGTISLWIKTLESIEVLEDSKIFFLSGRYKLTHDFKIEDFEGNYVFKKPWQSKERGGWYGTQLFMVKGSHKDEFVKVLKTAINKLNRTAIDVECALYQTLTENAIPVVEIETVYCEGIQAPSGRLERH
jgi:hypothetical protein